MIYTVKGKFNFFKVFFNFICFSYLIIDITSTSLSFEFVKKKLQPMMVAVRYAKHLQSLQSCLRILLC